MKKSELLANSLSGLPIMSKCLDYQVPSKVCSPVFLSNEVSIIKESKPDPASAGNWIESPVARKIYSGVTKSTQDSFCGKVNSWIPSFRSVYKGTQSDAYDAYDKATSSQFSTSDSFNTPGICSKDAYHKDSTLGTLTVPGMCMAAGAPGVPGSMVSVADANSWIRFPSPAVDWAGYCIQGKCQVCVDGMTRCQNDGGAAGFSAKNFRPDLVNGVPQVCVNGQWAAARGYGLLNIDKGMDSVLYDVNTKSLVAVTVLTAICFLALLVVAACAGRRPAAPAVGP